MKKINEKWLWSVLAACLLALAAVANAGSASYSRIIVFGDSISDPGNVFAIKGELAQAPFSLIPQAPYAIGGHHFSNGNTWVEQLATDLGVANTVGPAFAAPPPFSNYAVGGSTARYMAMAGSDMDLATQVSTFLAQQGQVDQEALVVIMIGGNDIFDALESSNPSSVVAEAVQAIVDQLFILNAAGAKHVLVANAPNIGKTPAALMHPNPAVPYYAQLLSDGFNDGLQGALAMVSYYTGMEIKMMDTYGAMMDAINNADKYGLSNVSEPCITPGVVAHALCGNAKKYLFWDGIHPTVVGHAILRDAAMDALNGAPISLPPQT